MMMMMLMLMEVMQTSSAYTDTRCVVHFKLEHLHFCYAHQQFFLTDMEIPFGIGRIAG